MKKGKINNNSNSSNTMNTINTQNTLNTTNNQKINFSELEQLELGLNEVSLIYEEYIKTQILPEGLIQIIVLQLLTKFRI